MFDRRALPGTLVGFAALVLAVAAMVTQQAFLVVLAGIATIVCVVLVLAVPSRAPVRYKERKTLREEAQKLAEENDRMAARAAKFEAEAISAREKLAAAMLADEAAAPHDDQAAPADTAVDITDPETGIFTQVFFDASLGKRVSAARRGLRPLTVAVIEVVTGVGEPAERHAPPKPIANILVQTLREADTVARMDDGSFAILLEDTPENGAIWTLERIRRRISEDLDGHTVRAGMSCYPAYAFDADQLSAQSRHALEAAREWRQDRIEVTTASPDD